MSKCLILLGKSGFLFITLVFGSLGLGQTTEPQEFPTASENVTVIVRQVDVQATGTMRWAFLVRNQAETPYVLNLVTTETYIADDFGNRYIVADTSYKEPFVVEPYVGENVWFDFVPPENPFGELCGLKQFKVSLSHNQSSPGGNTPFTQLIYRGTQQNILNIQFTVFDVPLNVNCTQ
jgi:hypothetical protein